MEAYKAAIRHSAFCGPEVMQNGDKRESGRAEQYGRADSFTKPEHVLRSDQHTKADLFRRKRRCKSISTHSINEISDLEVSTF